MQFILTQKFKNILKIYIFCFYLEFFQHLNCSRTFFNDYILLLKKLKFILIYIKLKILILKKEKNFS